MKQIIFFLLLLPSILFGQSFTAPIVYRTGVPTAPPSASGSRYYQNLTTGFLYQWDQVSAWNKVADGIDVISGSAAPAYTPGIADSKFAINADNELYYYTGSVWVQINAGATYTAGTGIAISGANEISNTAPDQTVSITGATGTYPNFAIPTISEPINQVVYGTGTALDSDTGATYANRILYGANLKMQRTVNNTTGILYSGNTPIIHFYQPNADSIPADNIFIGRNSGNFTMASVGPKYTAKKNISIGQGSSTSITTGYLNTVIGWESLKLCTECAGTIAIGGHVLENLTTAHDNLGIGDVALRNCTTGKENQAVGYESLLNLTTGNNNSALGKNTGAALTTGSFNVFLGDNANCSTSSITNSVALGANAIATKNNQVVLGSSSITEIYAPAQILANKVGQNLRMTANGTDEADAGIYVGSTGTINFGNWNNTRGISVAATTGNISQLGTGTFRTGRLGVNASPDATAALNVSGTSLFSLLINANSVGGNFRFRADGTGSKDGGVYASSGGDLYFSNWDGNRGFKISAGGAIQILNTGLFQFGGTSSSFPALKRSGQGLALRLADDSADAPLTASNVISTSTVRLKGYTVATLPSGVVGDTAYVTDALAPTFGSLVVGGGAVVSPVFYNGSAWICR